MFKGTQHADQFDREIVPYQRQYSFDPRKFSEQVPSDWGNVNKSADIKAYWIKFINDKGNYPYLPGVPQKMINQHLKDLKNKK